jgi:hypothetical protein
MNNLPVTKNYDKSNAVDANTGIFTAPVSGFYRFIGSVELTGITNSHNDAQLIISVHGISQQDYLFDRHNPGTQMFGSAEARLSGEIMVPMTAGDTAYLKVLVSGTASKNVGILFGDPTVNYRTVFQGQFV